MSDTNSEIQLNHEVNAEQINKYLLNLATINSSIGKLEALNIYIDEKYSEDRIMASILVEALDELILLSGIKNRRAKITELNKTVPAPTKNKNPLTPDTIAKIKAVKDIKFNRTPQKPVEKVYKKQLNFNQPNIHFDIQNSTNMKCFDYKPYTSTLYITYLRDDRQYAYYEVPREEILEAVNAPKASEYLNNIKSNYRYEEITESCGVK